MPMPTSNEVRDKIIKHKQNNETQPNIAKWLMVKLICGKCGAFMAGESGAGKSGKKHYYYKCSHAKNKRTCDKKAIKKD